MKSPRISIQRVKQGKQLGGHFVGETDIARRYKRGLLNLFGIYMDLCDYWAILDNMRSGRIFVAEGTDAAEPNIFDDKIWMKIKSTFRKYEARL